jgi:hypothetical protein
MIDLYLTVGHEMPSVKGTGARHFEIYQVVRGLDADTDIGPLGDASVG